ncbi:MAG: type II toxin-antitoxin system VapC family toxin [Verrucomicrobia bacterium]|nr:type II toxin-antitoxin system VapC family toxin [Verrucomicrobiota bacterium]
MIVPDVNLLIYAYDSTSPHHDAAAVWWQGCMTGTEEVGLAAVVVFGFVRLCTHPGVFQNPLTIAEATRRVESWLAMPRVRIIEASPHHIAEVLGLLAETGTAGNLTTDAQIAALARQEKAILHSNDTDFQRFPGIRWLNPLTGKSQVT